MAYPHVSAVSIACGFTPSPSLRDYVSVYQYRDHLVANAAVTRPVSAQPDSRLVFCLGDPSEAYEYATGKTRILPEVMIVGPQTRRVADLSIRGRHHTFIVCFQPAGLKRLFGLPDSDLVDSAEDGAQLLGPELQGVLQRLREIQVRSADPLEMLRCVESFLAGRLSAAGSEHAIHRAAFELNRSNGLANLCRLVSDSGHGVRQFNRTFLQQIGMTPKRYARIARFGYAVRLKLDSPALTWTEVSQQAGYYDQNHLVKDFRSLVGEVPSAYLKAMISMPEPLRPRLSA